MTTNKIEIARRFYYSVELWGPQVVVIVVATVVFFFSADAAWMIGAVGAPLGLYVSWLLRPR